MVGVGEDRLPGISRTELQPHAARAHAHDGADFEPLEANGIDAGLGPLRALQSQARMASTRVHGPCRSSLFAEDCFSLDSIFLDQLLFDSTRFTALQSAASSN